MADDSRQNKLAAAKKKLKEYQQKNSPVSTAGAKKKRRSKETSRPETPVSDGVPSPGNIENLLKVLVSDFNCSNGVALPSLDKWKDRGWQLRSLKELKVKNLPAHLPEE